MSIKQSVPLSGQFLARISGTDSLLFSQRSGYARLVCHPQSHSSKTLSFVRVCACAWTCVCADSPKSSVRKYFLVA